MILARILEHKKAETIQNLEEGRRLAHLHPDDLKSRLRARSSWRSDESCKQQRAGMAH